MLRSYFERARYGGAGDRSFRRRPSYAARRAWSNRVAGSYAARFGRSLSSYSSSRPMPLRGGKSSLDLREASSARGAGPNFRSILTGAPAALPVPRTVPSVHQPLAAGLAGAQGLP